MLRNLLYRWRLWRRLRKLGPGLWDRTIEGDYHTTHDGEEIISTRITGTLYIDHDNVVVDFCDVGAIVMRQG